MNGLQITLLVILVIVVGVLIYYLVDNKDSKLTFVDWVKNKFAKKCTLDSECGTGKTCKDGKCVVVPPCTSGSCGTGKTCISGTCVNDPEFAKKQMCSALYKVITGIGTFNIGSLIENHKNESEFCGIFNKVVTTLDETTLNYLNSLCSMTYNQAYIIFDTIIDGIIDGIIDEIKNDTKVSLSFLSEAAKKDVKKAIKSKKDEIIEQLQKSGCIQANCAKECGKTEWCINGTCKELEKGIPYKNIDGSDFTIDEKGYVNMLSKHFWKCNIVDYPSTIIGDVTICTDEDCDIETVCGRNVVSGKDTESSKFTITDKKNLIDKVSLYSKDNTTGDNEFKIKVLEDM